MGAISVAAFSSTRCRRTRGSRTSSRGRMRSTVLMQALAVIVQVEAQDRDVDDGDVEVSEGGGGGAGDAFEPGAHDVPGILGRVHQDRACVHGGEVSQGGAARGDGHGEVEGEEGLAAFGLRRR